MFGGISDPRLVLVTGAGSGIGRATALRFAKHGATVLVSDIDEATAKQTAALIIERGGQAYATRLDVTDDTAWADYAVEVLDRHGVPDVLVNNAGIVVIGGFLDQSKRAWDHQMSVNLDGVINGCRAFAPLMADARRGQIVNVASVMAFSPSPLAPSYNVAKAGVRMFSECLRGELAPYRVGVSVVCPGAVATNIGKGEITSDVGLPPDRVAGLQRGISELIVTLGPALGFGPDIIARGIVRAVRYNLAVLPVRPEAWAMFAAARLSPGLYRLALAQADPARVAALARFAARVIPDRVIRAFEA
ncbi:SDR family NAD(P)-dependent oxidoreductase [Nocardia huaxiensis]|uniref:SDR family NAD(P)-dependent oxidoreductase n=1 Tax=Nocardia huaxiensis TaxID=2755382 RepID=A0A7D6VD54_9NOCA|nr:SDR family NAD(P)-dependent oxidoreductase [Nocardia huaxiensis]QLY29555.1 SDR family NAD(P)-dependent oxidoreductase [Nocardia huaxiensis]